MAIKRSRTKPHRFTADVLLPSNRMKYTQDIQLWGQSQVFVISQKNREGITLKPTQKSATASETINALVLVRRFRLLQTRKIVNPFPMMVRNERNQPRIQNQVSILAVKGSSVNYEIMWFYLYSKPVNYFRELIWRKRPDVLSGSIFQKPIFFKGISGAYLFLWK